MQDMTITLSLHITDVNKVLAGLGNLPFKDSADLIANIKQQGDAQLAAHLASLSQDKGDNQGADDAQKPH